MAVNEEKSDPRIEGLAFIGGMVALMWVVQLVNAVDDYKLDPKFGLLPRHVSGLDGVVFSPFLHASWGHLIGNTVPFAVLGGIVALSGLTRLLYVTAIVAVVGGLGTWLVAPAVTTVGASGVVFGFAGYLVARGVFTRNLLHLAGGVAVAAVFGTALLSGLLPNNHGISWQGHLFGGIGGIVAARLLSATPEEKKPAASNDPLAGLV
jgi:membrane associated rhomboid family serine protease